MNLCLEDLFVLDLKIIKKSEDQQTFHILTLPVQYAKKMSPFDIGICRSYVQKQFQNFVYKIKPPLPNNTLSAFKVWSLNLRYTQNLHFSSGDFFMPSK